MTVHSPIQNARGQGLVEYLIIVALIAVATIGVVRVMGQAISSRFATISYALQGEKKTPRVDDIDENLLRKKDLGNFMNGVGGKGTRGGDSK
jgi:pilus assembly protein Flp/PilA